MIKLWRKNSETSKRHWLTEPEGSSWSVELETNYRDLERCAEQVEEILG